MWAIRSRLVKFKYFPLFFPTRAIYAILYDPTTEHNQVMQWLQYLKRSFFFQPTVMVVGMSTRIGGEEEKVHKQNAVRFLSMSPSISETFGYYASKHKTFDSVHDKLHTLITNYRDSNKTMDAGTGILKRRIGSIRKTTPYLNRHELDQVIMHFNINDIVSDTSLHHRYVLSVQWLFLQRTN